MDMASGLSRAAFVDKPNQSPDADRRYPLYLKINYWSMGKRKRRELKAEGKRLVEENSKLARQQLFERNPFPVGHPNWVANLKAEYALNRAYRRNTTEVLIESEVLENASIKECDFDFELGFIPRAGWYVLCKSCRCLVPAKSEIALGCQCDEVIVDPKTKQVRLPDVSGYRVVELVAHGPIRASRPWWRLW